MMTMARRVFVFLGLTVATLSQAQNPAVSRPNWTKDEAVRSAVQAWIEPQLGELLQLAGNSPDQLADSLIALDQDFSMASPAREKLFWLLAKSLANQPALPSDHPVMTFLLNYPARVLVPHGEAPGVGVPLFPVRAAAMGSLGQWQFAAALRFAQTEPKLEILLSRYQSESRPGRRGLRQGLASRDKSFLAALLNQSLDQLSAEPEFTALAGETALLLSDVPALARVFNEGQGAAMVELARRTRSELSPASTESLLTQLNESSSASDIVTSVMRTHPRVAGQALADKGQETGSIETWTEQQGVLGLGYPVPIPVDTPLPFDGFRSYAGLHQRHQSLANQSSQVQGVVVGETHAKRDIWAYRVGDADLLTRDLRPEPAMLTNGGIHAREWQTPEVVTGIMERLINSAGDGYWVDYLLDNANVVLVPVMNIDGFTQTQRFPTTNWLRTDPSNEPGDPSPSPRDGRMRRKNMPGVDEILETRDDHLEGVDLNRNSPPFHATNPNRSSDDTRSLVYHGPGPHSEPEWQALLAAAELGPSEQLRAYTDVHSFSQVFYFARTDSIRLTTNTVDLLNLKSQFNASLPDGSVYLFDASPLSNINTGFGLSNEYFTQTLGIPAWGVEVEPNGGGPSFPGNPPGCGANYGGLGNNCHDGFILPESEIRRVRSELSHTFVAAYFHQTGPPSVAAVRVIDDATNALVFEAEWDPSAEGSRQLNAQQIQPLALDRDYTLWIAHDRPMRWRVDGEISAFPGQPASGLNHTQSFAALADSIEADLGEARWANAPGDAPDGYFRYQDDALVASLRFPSSDANLAAVSDVRDVTLSHNVIGMTGHGLDANPATAISWSDGGWSFLEDATGAPGDTGGADSTVEFSLSRNDPGAPFLIQPATTAAWFDDANNGEGFLLEILADDVAVMYWFTYDDDGQQAWYVANGRVTGNQLVFPELIVTRGGRFGPNFDPAEVERQVVGSARFVYNSCDTGTMVYELPGKKGRLSLQRLSQVDGLSCTRAAAPSQTGLSTGSWFNVDQSGHGFVVEVLEQNQALVYWFTYDLDGNQAWFFGAGSVADDDLLISETFATSGPSFGSDFDPDDLVLSPWGELRLTLGCSEGQVQYDGSLFNFPAATLALTRLTVPSGLECE
ncbi:MAG: M14 family zinc carboxypeptidase [Lysobacterales bacterium]